MFGLFSKPRHRRVGVHISPHSITVVELSCLNGVFQLESHAVETLPATLMIDQTRAEPKSVAQVLLRALDKAGVVARDAVVALPDTQIICKRLEVEAGLSESDLELHMRLEAEQHVPYALEEVALDYEVENHPASHSGRVNVLLVICRQEALEWHQSVLLGAGLKAQVIAVQAHALVRAIDWMVDAVAGPSRQDAVAVVEFMPRTTLLSVVCQGEVLYSRELLFERGVQGDEDFKITAVQHLRRGLELFAESGAERVPGLIVLAGAAASSIGLHQWVEEQLGTPTHIANPFVAMSLNRALVPEALLCDAPLLLTACGLALRGFD